MNVTLSGKFSEASSMRSLTSIYLGSAIGVLVSLILYVSMLLLTYSNILSPTLGSAVSRLTLMLWPAGYGFGQGAEGLGVGSVQYFIVLGVAIALNALIYAALGILVWGAFYRSRLFWVMVILPLGLYWRWALFA